MIPVVVISSEATRNALRYCQLAWNETGPLHSVGMRFFVVTSSGIKDELLFPNWSYVDAPVGIEFGRSLILGQEVVYSEFGKNYPYLVWLDDYILRTIDPDAFIFMWDMMRTLDFVDQMRLLPCPGPKIPGTTDQSVIGIIRPQDPYAISFQAAFWRNVDRYVEPEMSPWQAEIAGSKQVSTQPISNIGAFLGARVNIVSYENLYRRGRLHEDAMENVKRMGL